MKRYRSWTLALVATFVLLSGYVYASHNEPWWCSIPLIGNLLPGCDDDHGGGGGGGGGDCGYQGSNDHCDQK